MTPEYPENEAWMRAMNKLRQDKEETHALLEEDLRPSYLPIQVEESSSKERNRTRQT